MSTGRGGEEMSPSTLMWGRIEPPVNYYLSIKSFGLLDNIIFKFKTNPNGKSICYYTNESKTLNSFFEIERGWRKSRNRAGTEVSRRIGWRKGRGI